MRIFSNSKNQWWIIGLLLLYALSVLVNLGLSELSGEEPRRAMVTVEMIESGNYIKPTQYTWNYYNKPPLWNWVLATVILVTGSVSEAVLRLPSLFFYLAMAAVQYLVMRRYFPKRIALLAAFFTLTCVDVYTYGLANGVEMDIFHGFLIYVQAISLFWFFQRQKWAAFYTVSYLFCAVAFLTKAFPALLFQVLTLAALCFQAKSVRVIFRWQHLIGLSLFTGIVGGYFFLYAQQAPADRFLVNLFHEATLKSAVGERSHKVWEKAVEYPSLVLKMLLPWSLLLVLLFFRKVKWAFKANPLTWFSVLFIVCNIGVYWFSGQPKGRYIYMFIPFACTVLAHIYHRFTELYAEAFNKRIKWLAAVFVLLVAGIILIPFFALVSLPWVLVLAVAFCGLIYAYLQTSASRIWLFVAGLMLGRLAYAALFIPLQKNASANYEAMLQKVVDSAQGQRLQYWAAANDMNIAIENKLFSYKLEKIKQPEILPLEIPYYYYRHTGQVMQFDTVPHKNAVFISTAGQLSGKRVDTIHAYFDKHDTKPEQRIVFFRQREKK